MLIKLERKPLPIFIFSAVFITMILLDVFALSFSSIFLILIGGGIGIIAYALFNTPKKFENFEKNSSENTEEADK